MKLRFSSLLSLCFLCGPVLASEEYSFDLKSPPKFAAEWFKVAEQAESAHAAGPSAGFNFKEQQRLNMTLTPPPRSSPEQWASYRYAQMCVCLTHLPNFDYLNKVRESSKDKEEVGKLLHAWSHDNIMMGITGTLGQWGLNPPDVSPRTKPEDVRKLRRYVVRLAAQVYKKANDAFDPDFQKTFDYKTTFDPRRFPGPKPVLSEKELDALRVAWRDEAWKFNMKRIHNLLDANTHILKSDLCVIFRSHLPGDKESIREMLIEAGFKTSAQRKAYWEHCRTTGAVWTMWEPADEQRLVTD